MRRLIILGMVVAVGTGVSVVHASPPDVAPNVRGQVLRGPVSPVSREGKPNTAPARGLGLAFFSHGVEVARVVTGKEGKFSLTLRAGTYTVRTVKRMPFGPLTPRSFRVESGVPTLLKLQLDTGIRAPSPGTGAAL